MANTTVYPKGGPGAAGEVKNMSGQYEADGVLEDNQVIRLKEPLPCKAGPVKVIVTPQLEASEPGKPNRAALDALTRLLREPDDLTPEQWEELEKVIQQHPLRIRKGTPA